jgi:hypothetical protein
MFLNKFVFLPYDVTLDDLGDPVYVLWQGMTDKSSTGLAQ